MKKDLPKAMKGVKADDRLLLIGLSTAPFDAEPKPFCSLYQKIVLIPRPDYASRHCKPQLSIFVIVIKNEYILGFFLHFSHLQFIFGLP